MSAQVCPLLSWAVCKLGLFLTLSFWPVAGADWSGSRAEHRRDWCPEHRQCRVALSATVPLQQQRDHRDVYRALSAHRATTAQAGWGQQQVRDTEFGSCCTSPGERAGLVGCLSEWQLTGLTSRLGVWRLGKWRNQVWGIIPRFSDGVIGWMGIATKGV